MPGSGWLPWRDIIPRIPGFHYLISRCGAVDLMEAPDALLVFLVWLVHRGNIERAWLRRFVEVIREELWAEEYEG